MLADHHQHIDAHHHHHHHSLDVNAAARPAAVGPRSEADCLVTRLEGTLHLDGTVRFLHDERVLLHHHRVHELPVRLDSEGRVALRGSRVTVF